MKFRFATPIVIALALAFTFVSPHAAQAQDKPQRIEIVAKRFEYTPPEITLKKDVPVVLALTSKDTGHGLKFKGLGIDLKVKKGKTSEVTFTPTQVGTFVGQCSVFCGPGHGSMKMTLHVTE